jgi:sugar/nucleoside kinase (ribokinase family)
MAEIVIMGEMIVEIMRDREGAKLYEPGYFRGPFPSGAPAICIDTAARLGRKTAIIGGVGKDDFGKCILDRLKKDGVDCSYVLKSSERSTGTAFVTYFEDGSRKFIFHMGNTPAVEAKAPDIDAFADARFMHIMGCSLMAHKGFAQEILKTMRKFVKNGTKISFDPNIRKELFTDKTATQAIDEVFSNTSVFLPGVEELLLITKKNNVENAVEACFEKNKMEIVVVKNGAKGCQMYTREKMWEIGAYPINQVDVTGAGDCFDGAFLSGLLEGREILEAAKMGAAAGALNAAAFGPMEGDISLESIQKMIEQN